MSPSPQNLRVDAERGVVHPCQVVDLDGWKTPFTAVSWSYACPTPKSRSSFVYAKPPHYHHSLFCSYRGSASSDPPLGIGADDLNPDLVGVKAAGDVLQKYEIDVGFYYADQSNFALDLVSSQQSPPSCQGYLCGEVDDEEVMLNRERWHDLVRGLTYGVLDGDSSPSSSANIRRSTSTLSSIDLSDSGRSVFSNSMPSTPKPKNPSARIVVKDQSPASSDGDRIYYPSRLNASASSFVPTSMSPEKVHSPPSPPSIASMSTPSPTFTDFTFPSLNSSPTSMQSRSPPSVVLETDEHGFYKEVVSSLFHGTASSSGRHFPHLPPLLPGLPYRRKPLSKTRTIVDRLRILDAQRNKSKSTSPSPSPNTFDSVFSDPDLDVFKTRLSLSEDGGDSRSVPASDVEKDDGWIRPDMSEVSSETKALRTRDLCLALGRDRAGSGAKDKDEKWDNDIDLGYQFLNEQSAIYSQSSAVNPEVTYNDGWIEGRSPSASRPRKLRSGNMHPSASFPSLTSSQTPIIPSKPQARFTATPLVPMPVPVQPTAYFPAVPVMYPAYAHPFPAIAGYVQMQMHIQSQLQPPMQHPWFQHVSYPVPLVLTAAPRFTNSHSNHVPMAGSDRPIATGASGTRHA